MKKALGKLQSSSDIRGIALKNEEKEVTLNEEIVRVIGKAFPVYMAKKLGKSQKDMKISVGSDPRLTGEKFKGIFIEELANSGMEVYDFGISTTPSMFMSTVFEKYSCDAAVMFTASHLPFYYNGMKFFTREGGFEKEDIKQLIALASTNNEETKIIKKGKINKSSILKD